MSKDNLQDRKVAIEQRFNELAKIKADTEAEMRRLEGEHRLVIDLLNSTDEGNEDKVRKRMRKVIDAQT